MARSPLIHRAQRGVTLIEVMVAVAIGLVILLALTLLFSRNSSNQAELEASTRQMENARYAADTLGEAFVHAGFYGEFNPADLTPTPTYATPDPCATASTALGWTTPANPTAGLSVPAALTGYGAGTAIACAGNRRAGTEAVALRHMDTRASTALAAMVPGNLYVQVSRCADDIGQILAGTSQNAADMTLRNLGCTAVNTEVWRYMPSLYYVASCNDCAANDGIPTLKRVQLVDGALRTVALAEGVENLQVEYGIDRDNDGRPDVFARADAIGTATSPVTDVWNNVIAVRLHLLTRNAEPTAGYTDPRTYQLGEGVTLTPADAYKRTLTSTTVRLVNVAGRRE